MKRMDFVKLILKVPALLCPVRKHRCSSFQVYLHHNMNKSAPQLIGGIGEEWYT